MQGVTGQSKHLLQCGEVASTAGPGCGKEVAGACLEYPNASTGQREDPQSLLRSHLPELWVTGLEHLVIPSCRRLLSQKEKSQTVSDGRGLVGRNWPGV